MNNETPNGNMRLAQIWNRLDVLCGKLWKEDHKAAVGLQAVVEEFRDEVTRAEKTVSNLHATLAHQRGRIESEISAKFTDRAVDLEERLAAAKEHASALERTLARERKRVQELSATLDAKEIENAHLQEDYLKTESLRDAERAEKMQSFINGLHEKEEQLEQKWIERRQQLEVEYEEMSQNLQKSHLEELRALKERAMEMEKDLLTKESALQTSHETLRHELDAKEAKLRSQSEELRRRENDLEKYRTELETSWDEKRRDLDEIKRSLREEIKNVVREYQSKKES